MENHHSEDVRVELIRYVKTVSEEQQSLAFGSKLARPTYELVPLSKFSQDSLVSAIRITADRARRSWTDLRAAVRLMDLEFVITFGGRELAVLHRHPENNSSKVRLQRWLDERDNHKNETIPEDRMARLEREVKELQRRIGHDPQK